MSFSLRLYAKCDRCACYSIHVDTDEARVWAHLKAQGWYETWDKKHLCPKCSVVGQYRGWNDINFPVKIEPR